MAEQDLPTTPEGDAPTLDVGITESAPAAAPRRRRATKKAAAPVTTPDQGTRGDETPEVHEAPEADAPVKKAAKKTAKKAVKKTAKKATRATKAAAAPTAESASTEPAPDPEVVEPEILEPAVGQAVIDPEAEVDEDVEQVVAEPAAAEAPAAPSFGLLFQAPDVSAPRRRRATSPAQAPTERPAPPVAQEPAPADDTDQPTAERTDDASADDSQDGGRRRRRGGRGRRGRGAGDKAETTDSGPAEDTDEGDEAATAENGDTGPDEASDTEAGDDGTSRRRRRRRRSGSAGENEDPPGTVTRVREPRKERDEPTAVKGSTRLEAKKQRRREGREAGRRRTIITEAEFLARRESVERIMAVRGKGDKTQIAVLEDGVLVEHYVSRESNASMAGNVYLGRVQNVLPSMEAAFVDIGKGRNAVLYAGEVNWDAAGLEQHQAKRIENALGSGDTVLCQVTKDPIGHKGARLTSQISLPGRYLVYVPEGSMTGISRKLPDTERARLKAILKEVVPDSAGVIVRTAAEGASEEELRADVERLTKAWDAIQAKAKAAANKKGGNGGAPVLLHGEADLTVRVIRDVFTEDFSQLIVSGDQAWSEVSGYVEDVAPDLARRLTHWTAEEDLFTHHRVDEQIAKAMDRKVWLPSGGSLVIDRTEAMTVVDVNTGKFVGSGGNLEETVTKNNIEAAEEIVRQLRLRDIGGIIVIDFIDMVLESNRDLVVRRLLECLGRDRTKHQVAEVTSLGLVQMTRKRVGSGLIEVFSEPCEHCAGRGIIVQAEPVDRSEGQGGDSHGHNGNHGSDRGAGSSARGGRSRRGKGEPAPASAQRETAAEAPSTPSGPTAAQIAAAAHAAAIKSMSGEPADDDVADLSDPVTDETTSPQPETEPGDETGTPEQVTPATAAEDLPFAAPVEQSAPEAPAPPVEAEPAPLDQPVVRARRKRGRVVAPAGPPKAADLEQSEGDR
ncbi:Rne/Rng family ribonuclease [Knoellia sp. CPCC 206435]|uniref:Rne/Rng family ribonuclease n=1 Tax=Knoellia terrae TaxID=3404797 RepID=UPI003B42C831